MSVYTTQVRWLVEHYAPDTTMSMSERIDYSLPYIFNFNFPIWNEAYRPILERKIIYHFFNKEIAMETVQLWRMYLEERLNLIMPYYNQLYETTVKEYDYLADTNVTETYDSNRNRQDNKTIDSTNSSTGKTTSGGTDSTRFNSTETNKLDGTVTPNTKTLQSDLPQANYSGIDYGTVLTENTGNTQTNNTNTITQSGNTESDLSNTEDKTNSGTSKTTNAGTEKEDENFTRTKKGANGGRSINSLLMEYRQTLLNIDRMIIEELVDLFMLIY